MNAAPPNAPYTISQNYPSGSGYISYNWMVAADPCGTPVASIPMGEEFPTGFVADYAGENWPSPVPNSWTNQQNADFVDMVREDCPPCTPTPQNPQNPLRQTLIYDGKRLVLINGYAAVMDIDQEHLRDHGVDQRVAVRRGPYEVSMRNALPVCLVIVAALAVPALATSHPRGYAISGGEGMPGVGYLAMRDPVIVTGRLNSTGTAGAPFSLDIDRVLKGPAYAGTTVLVNRPVPGPFCGNYTSERVGSAYGVWFFTPEKDGVYQFGPEPKDQACNPLRQSYAVPQGAPLRSGPRPRAHPQPTNSPICWHGPLTPAEAPSRRRF